MATAEESVTSVESGSTDFFDNICQPCEYDGNILEAEGRCEDCDEYLCKPCFLAHTVPFKLRHHVMKRKDQLDKDGSHARQDQCTQKCYQHAGEIIKYYCSTHSVLGCSACMILNHTSCSGNIFIPEVAKDVLSSAEYNDFKASKSAIETTSQEIQTDAKERIETINTGQTAAVEKLRRFKKEIIDLFETAEKELIDNSENVKEEELKKQASILDKSASVDKDLRDLTSSIESFESLNQYCNMYMTLMKTRDVLKSCVSRLGEIDQRKDPHKEIRFSPNDSIISELLSCRGIGKINDGITQVKHERDLNVKTQNDTNTCWITSSVILQDNKLIITDCGNNKLKMIDTRQDNVVEELAMSAHPWDMTATRSNEVAVTLIAKKIAFVKTDGKLVNHRNIDVDGKCRGVAYHEDSLVVTYTQPPKVEVMDMKGVVLRTLQNDDTIEVKLEKPLYVVNNSVNNAIYISDPIGSKIVCLKSDGTLKSTYIDTNKGTLIGMTVDSYGSVKSTYTDTDLGLPTGMTVDSFGNVYVCDWKKHTVHQITKDCKKKSILLTEKDLTKPYAISYCEAEDKFYIGMRENDIVKVFKVI